MVNTRLFTFSAVGTPSTARALIKQLCNFEDPTPHPRVVIPSSKSSSLRAGSV